MKTWSILQLLLICITEAIADHREPVVRYESENEIAESSKVWNRVRTQRRHNLRVMTFNILFNGGRIDDALEKIARHISKINPHIVFLQEISKNHADRLLTRLDKTIWTACPEEERDTQIITRLDIATTFDRVPTFNNNGCQIRFYPPDDDLLINVWNLHLTASNYGPYKACNKTAASVEELYAWETRQENSTRSRLAAMINLTLHEPFAALVRQADTPNGPPFVVAGDFNAPSHLDWTEPAKHLHCQWAFDWPVSKHMAQLGFMDSYRVLRPDPVTDPGNTWSPVYKISMDLFRYGNTDPEPQDRIDYIYYKGHKLRVVNSFIYAGDKPISLFPQFLENDWSSDHSVVVTDFVYTDN